MFGFIIAGTPQPGQTVSVVTSPQVVITRPQFMHTAWSICP